MRPLSRSWARALVALALAGAVAAALPTAAFATKTLGLSTGSFKFDVEAGQTVDGEVYITNDGDENIKVLVYVADQQVDEAGNITYTTPSRGDVAALQLPSSWANVKMPADSKSLGNIPYVEMKPGQRVPIKFAFTAPPTVPPGDHDVMMFFEVFELPTAASGGQAQVSGRLGSRITLRVAGDLVEKLEIRPFAVPAYVIGATVPYDFTVQNQGNVNQRVTANVSLLDRNEATVATATAIDARLVFAGENLETSGTVTATRQPFGPHTVRVELVPVDDEGKPIAAGKNTLVEERTVWLVPMWLVVAVAVVLVVIIAAVIWAIGRRSGSRRAAKAQVGSDAAVQPASAPSAAHESVVEPDDEEALMKRLAEESGERSAE